jgi:hypothetical protein
MQDIRYPFLLGLVQVMEVDPSQNTKILTSVYKFVSLTNQMLKVHLLQVNLGLEETNAIRIRATTKE